MRLLIYAALQLVALLALATVALGDNSNTPAYDANSFELSQLKVVFPNAELVPCSQVNDMTAGECVKTRIYLGYLTWSVHSAIRFSDLDFEINSQQSRWKAFKQFAQPVPTARSPKPDDVAARRDEFLQKNSLSACLRSACGKILRFKNQTPHAAALFWDRSSKFILCMEHRNRNADPKAYDVGPAYFYRLAAQGKINDCRPGQYPSGLAELIHRINPGRSF
jgi:hypothetical protein